MDPVSDGHHSAAYPNQAIAFVFGLGCMILEGYDTYAVSYVGPALSRLWNISPAQLGILFTSGVVGSAVAYLGIGPLTRGGGRRGPVIIGTLCFGVATLAEISAHGVGIFIAWRVVAGLCLGAVLPNVVSLVAESLAPRRRSFAVVVLYSGFGIGSALAGRASAYMLREYDWRGVFVLGGLLPLILAVLMLGFLHESPAVPSPRGPGPLEHPLVSLFSHGRMASTLTMWVLLTMDGTAIGALVFWLPTLVNRAGQSVAVGINFSVVFLIGGVLGAILIGYCMDRLGSYRVLLPVHLVAGVSIVLAGLMLTTAPVALAFLIGMTLNGGTSGVQGLLAQLYPTRLRTTGIGWASGVSRLAGIGQPLVTGFLLQARWSPRGTLLACAVPLLVSMTALAVLRVDRHGAAAAQCVAL